MITHLKVDHVFQGALGRYVVFVDGQNRRTLRCPPKDKTEYVRGQSVAVRQNGDQISWP